MLPYSDSRFTRYALGVFFVLVLAYAYYEAQGILFGPRIDISPEASAVNDPYIKIEGHAEHIASLSMNGKQVAVTEAGGFSEPYLLAPGTNRIILEAKDKYGHRTERTIEIVYDASSNVPLPAASTTAASSAEASTSTVAPTP